jgi:hypothetical protein
MRYLWVDEGNNPDWDTVARHDITGLFFAIRDPRVTQAYLIDVRERGKALGVNGGRGYAVGVYVGHGWTEFSGDGATFARKVSDKLGTIVPITSGQSFPKVQLNVEQHDPQFIQDMVVAWRKLRKYRDTSWTMEGMQGGWMTDNMVKAVKAARIRVVPQTFTGDMTPQDVDAVIKNLTDRGFEKARITPFRDARLIKPSEQGFYFTMGRLPR